MLNRYLPCWNPASFRWRRYPTSSRSVFTRSWGAAMNQNEARSLVAKLNAELLQSGLAVDTNPVVPFKVADRVRLSWPEARVSQGLFADQHFASLSEYRTFVEGRHYTCLLNEGSLIQISFDFRRNEMVAHRFCFYPCPLEFPEDGYPQDLDAWNDLL